MFWMMFSMFAAFVGIYMNIWFLFLLFDNKPKIMKSRNASFLPDVSILIPACNEEKTISRTLDSVFKLDYPASKLETIVVSNGSSDRTADIVREYRRNENMRMERQRERELSALDQCSAEEEHQMESSRAYKIKLIELAKPSKASALNMGTKAAKGELIALLDADTFVAPDSLKKMVGYFENPKVGAVTNFIKVDNPKGVLGSLQRIEYLFSAISKKLLTFLGSLYITPGTLSVIRKKRIEEIWFNNDTVTEDMDFAIEMRKRGHEIANAMDSVVYTSVPKTIGKLFKQRMRWYRGFMECTLKHKSIIFNRKFPNLGCFFIPASYIGILIGITLTFSFFKGVLKNALLFLRTNSFMTLSNQMHVSMASLSFNPKFLLLSPYNLLLFSCIFVSTIIVITLALKTTGQIRKRTMILLPVYMLVYYTMIMLFWFFAFLLEITGRERKW